MVPPRLLAALALAATLAIPTTASAAPRTTESHRSTAATAQPRAKAPTPLVAAAAVGQRYWGAVPCGGQIRVLAQRKVPASLAPDSDAWVTFDSPQGANDLAAPAGGYTNCTVSFARWRWPTAASMQEDWDLVCATMTHELGHLLGRSHDDTPGSVMATVFTDLSSVPPTCRATGPGRAARSARA